MKYRLLGNSELKVSSYCLGTMTFGETTSEEDSHYQLDESLASGINFIDTAEMYPTCPLRPETTGNTEMIVGNWIKNHQSKRSSVVLATKVSGKGYKAVRNGEGINAKSVKIAIEGSLKKLQTDYIDLYQLHWPDRGSYHFRQNWNYDPTNQKNNEIKDNLQGVLYSLSAIQKEGKFRYLGLSNETCWGTLQFIKYLKDFPNLTLVSTQNEYSLLCRLYDLDMAEMSHHENVSLLAYSPLAGGLLTGKYNNDKLPKNSRNTRVPGLFGRMNKNSLIAVSKYLLLAKKYQINPIHMSLAFCNQRPFMGSVIFGATNNLQFKNILKGLNVVLSDELMSEINDLYKKFPITF
ncbi:aldo/keto reductase [bacterium]|nr:aldo/keto reductase [bacterium]